MYLCGMDLRAIALRLAARTDVLNQVDRAFSAVGIYPPSMREIADNTYVGDIDEGWTLEVKEGPDGSLQVSLNGREVGGLDAAAVAFKGKDPKFLKRRPEGRSPSGATGSHQYVDWYRVNKAILDKNGVFHVDVDWKIRDESGVEHELSAKVTYEQVDDYDSENLSHTVTLDGKSVQDPRDAGLPTSDESLQPELVADLAVQDILEKKFGLSSSEVYDLMQSMPDSLDTILQVTNGGMIV